MRRVSWLALLLVLITLTPVSAQTLSPGQWVEHLNTAYTNSAAICGKPGAQPAPNCVPTDYGAGNAVSAWVDGDYATSLRLFVILRGGGHADGKGNQAIAYDPDANQWKLLTYPSRSATPITETTWEPRALYSDGTPSSVHTYGAVAWMDWLKKMWSAGGIYWSQGGESTPPRTWWWDANLPAVSAPTAAWQMRLQRPGGYGTYAVTDPDNRKVFVRTADALWEYDPSLDPGPNAETQLTHDYALGSTSITVKNAAGFPTAGVFRVNLSQHGVSGSVVFRVDSVAGNVWTGKAESGDKNITMAPKGIAVVKVLTGTSPYRQLYAQASVGNSAIAFDKPGRKLYRVASQTGGGVAVRRIDLNNLAAKEVALVTTGGPASAPNGAGLIYETRVKKLVMLGPAPVSGKSGLWSLTPENCGTSGLPACTWTQHTAPNGVYSAPSDTGHGTWKKFFRHDCDYVHIIMGTSNVWRVRPEWQTDTCGIAPPPQQTLTINPPVGGGTGTSTPPAGTHQLASGSVQALTFTPTTGTFTGWTGDADCTDGSVTMTGPRTCTPQTQLPTVTLTLTSTGSTGAGVIAGAGPYPQGSIATVTATPSLGSSVGAATGDQGCVANGTITMNANKTCNIPFLDVQAPAVSVSSPTENQLIKAATPLTFTVTDNMPNPVAAITLDGQPFEGTTLDPAVLSEGTHQVVVRGTDVAGNTTATAVNIISVKCPVCAIPSAAIVTVVKAGNGSGTVTGAGAYPVGAPVSLVATADAGSVVAGMAPALCAQHPTFPMPSTDLTCTVTFDKVVAQYQLNISQVGSGHGTVSGAGTYPDGTVVPISGTPAADSTGPTWSGDPDCADGSVVMTSSRTCIATFTLIPPPPDPTTRTLTTVITGPGTGTVSGAGQYAVGAAVTLTVTPAAGSVIAGITPAGGSRPNEALCSPWPFVMPSTDLTCTITFGLPAPNAPIAAPAGGPAVNLPIRTWAHLPYGILGQSKHARLLYDSKRKTMVVAGGDGTDGSGNSYTGQNVFSMNLAATSVWTRLHGPCPAAGGVMPARPDNTTWVYDSKRDQGTIMPAYYGGTATCAGVENDTLKRPYNFNFDTKQWILSTLPTPPNNTAGTNFGWGGDLHNHYGVYDPVTDATYRFYNGCGMQIIPMDGTTGVCLTTAFPNAPPGSSDQANDSIAIDVQGRMIYGINRWKRVLVKWSIVDRKVVEMIPLPPTWVRPVSDYGGSDFETHMAFDSKNRVLFLPNTMSYAGTLVNTTTKVNRGLNFFNVDTKVWEWEAAPVDNSVSGNVLAYDEANNVFLFLGRSVTKRMWLYKYK